jgi:hypothetical protein
MKHSNAILYRIKSLDNLLECITVRQNTAHRMAVNHEHIHWHLWDSFRTTTIIGKHHPAVGKTNVCTNAGPVRKCDSIKQRWIQDNILQKEVECEGNSLVARLYHKTLRFHCHDKCHNKKLKSYEDVKMGVNTSDRSEKLWKTTENFFTILGFLGFESRASSVRIRKGSHYSRVLILVSHFGVLARERGECHMGTLCGCPSFYLETPVFHLISTQLCM